MIEGSRLGNNLVINERLFAIVSSPKQKGERVKDSFRLSKSILICFRYC